MSKVSGEELWERTTAERLASVSPSSIPPADLKERSFAIQYAQLGNAARAFVQVYPERVQFLREQGHEGKPLRGGSLERAIGYEASALVRRNDVLAWIAYLKASQGDPLKLATGIMAEAMIVGTASERLAAAKAVLQRDEKKSVKRAFDAWKDLMVEVGATIRRPISKREAGEGFVDISLADVAGGTAQVALPKEAKIKLLHTAGAPWSESNPAARLSELQKRYLGKEERFLWLGGGSGLGKSVLGGSFGLCGLMIPGYRVAIVGDTYDLAWAEFEYVYQGFMRLFGDWAARTCVNVNTQTQHQMLIETLWGSLCRVYSLDRDEGQAALGKEFDLIIIGEASKVRHEIYEKKLLRALDRRIKRYGHIYRTGRCVGFTTPDGHLGVSSAICDRVDEITEGHPERLHVGACNWLESTYIEEGATVLENPDYPIEIYEARKRDLSPEAFAEQYEGKRTRKSGLVLSNFTEEDCCKPFPSSREIQRMRFGVGMDTGNFFGAVLVGLDQQSRVWALGDVLGERLSARANAQDLRVEICERLAPHLGLTCPQRGRGSSSAYDLAIRALFEESIKDRIELWFIDSNSQAKEDFEEALDVGLQWEKLPLHGTLTELNDWFATGELVLVDDLIRLPWEIARYRWGIYKKNPELSMKKSEQDPIQRNDHCIDGLRFIARQIRKLGPMEGEPAPVTLEQAFAQQLYHQVAGHLYDKLRTASQGDGGNFTAEFWREALDA